MAFRSPDEESYHTMDTLLKSGLDEDSLLKLAYEIYPRSDYVFQKGQCKDITAAEEKKGAGNASFVKKSNREALTHYNLGIMKCPQDTVEGRELLSILIANRTAVFIEIEEYEKVLKDISAIEEMGCYPAENKYKLYWRKAKCFEALGDFEKADNAFEEALKALRENSSLSENDRNKKIKLTENLKKNKKVGERKIKKPIINMLEDVETFKGGEKYVSASPLIDIVCDKVNGRYVVALEDIPVGTLILKEDAYVGILIEKMSSTHCQHCFVAVDQILPCPNCANVVFCSEACKKIAMESYHGIECPIYGSLYECGTNTSIALRIFTQKGFQFFFEQKDKLLSCLDDKRYQALPEKDVYLPDDHDNIMNLFRNEERGPYDVYAHLSTVFLMHALKLTSFFPFETEKDKLFMDDELFIAKLMLRHCRMTDYNIHGIGEIQPLSKTVTLRNGLDSNFQMVRIGIGLYPTFAFFNHSCEPSVMRTNVNRTILGRTIKPIRAGDAIYDNYGQHYLWATTEVRQEALKEDYCFDCTCTPCTEKWPLVEEMKSVVHVPCRNRNCNFINSMPGGNPSAERCRLCHRRFHPDAISSITGPVRKYLKIAEDLSREREYSRALKLLYQVLEKLYQYTNKPDLSIARVWCDMDYTLAHFGNKSIDYYDFCYFPHLQPQTEV